ncbi:MAG: D-alanine--D-alanine ligase [Oscillospiraceae bacterium]|nr:D-alanine--D-alanine ligase [Oscillospiraceae bacterium]
MAKTKVAIIFGGVSSEHDVSLISASSVIRNIDKTKYEVICIGITKEGRWLYYPGDVELIEKGEWFNHEDCVSAVISPDRQHRGILKIMPDGEVSHLSVDCVFPVLHGKNGEDGTIQGLFTLADIPFVGCDMLSSASCMDKATTHIILEQAGIKMAKWLSIIKSDIDTLSQFCDLCKQKLKFPMFVKPANAGSSIGVSKACDKDELGKAIKFAFTHDSKVIVEEQIIGKEVECAVLGNAKPEAATPGEIAPCNDFYDFDAKYVLNESKLFIPARVDADILKTVQQTAVKAYKAIGCSGLSRVDFFVTQSGDIYLNEINTLPGFTSISMYPKMWEADNMPYTKLITRLIELAFERAERVDG